MNELKRMTNRTLSLRNQPINSRGFLKKSEKLRQQHDCPTNERERLKDEKYSIQFITRGSEEWASWNGIVDRYKSTIGMRKIAELRTMRCNKKKKKLKQIAKYVKSYEIPCSFCEIVRWEWHGKVEHM